MRKAYKGEKIITEYFELGDKTPRKLQSNIVYPVKCLDCEAKYIWKNPLNWCDNIST